MAEKMENIIFDWNKRNEDGSPVERDELKSPRVHDETLRDGLGSPSFLRPALEHQISILRGMSRVGVYSADLGIPGANPRFISEVIRLIEVNRDEHLGILPCVAGRTHPDDVGPIIDIAQKTGVEIEALLFIGSSPIRMIAEAWDLPTMLRLTRESVSMAKSAGLHVGFVTEDTTRSDPKILRQILNVALAEGADGLVLCDTVGHATPDGVRRLMQLGRTCIWAANRPDVELHWHGHNDRGLALVNTLTAHECGAQRLHATALGIGERSGNCSLEQLLINLYLQGLLKVDLRLLPEHCELVSDSVKVFISARRPVIGGDAFRTATGVHAAAIAKCLEMGDPHLADLVYCAVPAAEVGRTQEIEIGPQSGRWNAVHWFKAHGVEPTEELVAMILAVARDGDSVLDKDRILRLVREFQEKKAGGA